MDCTPNEELLREGRARELVNRIQKSRKDEGLDVSDRIRLLVQADGKMRTAGDAHQAYIMSETLCLEWVATDQPQSNSFVIDDDAVSFSIEKME